MNTFLSHVSLTQFLNTSVVQPGFEERLVYHGCTVVANPLLRRIEASDVNVSLSQRALHQFHSSCWDKMLQEKAA